MGQSRTRESRGRRGYADDVTTIVQLIRAKQARLNTLEREARVLRAQLAAAGVSVSVRSPRTPQAPATNDGRPAVWPTTIAGRAVAALREAGRPMRIEQLQRAIARSAGTRVARATLVGQLARDVRKGRLFRRTGPNEYALARPRPGR